MKKRTLAVLSALLVVAVGGALLLAATRPALQRVERSAILSAPPAIVLAELIDLRRWSSWAPWPSEGPGVQLTFGGPPSGVGASCYWSDPAARGRGRLTVLAAGPAGAEVELEEEAAGTPSVDFEFVLASAGAGTRLTWRATREEGFRARLRSLLQRGDRAGAELERALAGLEPLATARAARAAKGPARSMIVLAAPSVVVAQLADLRRWSAWSPWERRYPGVRRTYGGPASGKGASCYFSGGAGAERGRLTVVRADAGKVEVERELESPSPSSMDLEFELTPQGGGTRITWSATGEPTLQAEAGDDLEAGLARLKALVEAEAAR